MAWVDVTGSNGIWEYENSATVTNSYPDSADGANSTVSGGIRTHTRPGTSAVTKTYLRVRKKGQINLWQYSEQIGNDAVWSNTAVNHITADSTTAPDGTTTADKIVPTAVATRHYMTQNPGPGVTKTMSVYAKSAGYDWIKLFITSSGTCSANFNVSTGALGTTGGAAFSTSTITNVGDGWYRCTMSSTQANTTNTGIYITSEETNPATLALSETGDGTSGCFLWGAQMSDGLIVTPYIKTTNAVSPTIERGEVSKTYFDAQ